jgi:hypothetical protein
MLKLKNMKGTQRAIPPEEEKDPPGNGSSGLNAGF